MTTRSAHGSSLWPARGQAPAWISTGRPTAREATEYLLVSNRPRQVFETEACVAWNPSNGPRIGTSWGRSASKDCQIVQSTNSGWWTQYPGGPDWMPTTPKTGSLFHADSQPELPYAAANLSGRPVDMWTTGFSDLLRVPRFPVQLRRPRNARPP